MRVIDRSQSHTIEDALTLLEQSLRILDERNAPAQIGARLEEVIESLKDEIRSRES